MGNVLVTGGAGLIGYNVARAALNKGHDVTIMDNLERSKLLGYKVSEERLWHNFKALQAEGVDCRLADITDPKAWNIPHSRYDYIFHLAAQCGVPPSIVNPERDWEVNATGTLNILQAARIYGSKVVYASTNKVYNLHKGWYFNKAKQRWCWDIPSWDDHGFPVDGGTGWAQERDCHESDLLIGSRTPYGNSKYAGDLLCQEWHHMYGVPTGIFRMSCIYGQNQFSFEEQGWITWFIIANLKGLPITVFGDGKQVRDCLYVSDVVNAYFSYMDSDVEHGIWNLGGGPSPKMTLSLDEALTKIEALTGKPNTVQYAPWRPSDQRVYTSDIRPLEEQFGWAPSVNVNKGLTSVVDWVRDNLHVF